MVAVYFYPNSKYFFSANDDSASQSYEKQHWKSKSKCECKYSFIDSSAVFKSKYPYCSNLKFNIIFSLS